MSDQYDERGQLARPADAGGAMSDIMAQIVTEFMEAEAKAIERAIERWKAHYGKYPEYVWRDDKIPPLNKDGEARTIVITVYCGDELPDPHPRLAYCSGVLNEN